MIVREHFRKFKDKRLLELLYDDLLTWNDWVFTRRTLPPKGLVSVGSDVVTSPPHDGHTKQAAIWETGMDNSPMYDQVTWSAAQNKMLIYDVGMTGEFLGEVEALAELAAALGKSADVAMLKARQAKMAATVNDVLWNATLGLYFNYQVDTDSFNLHTSPTSFYPMLSGTATPEQALAMTRRWLSKHSGYCLNTSAPAPPALPGPPPIYEQGSFMSGRYSSDFQDNAICIADPTCRAQECCPCAAGAW